jgi:hypothetical protein
MIDRVRAFVVVVALVGLAAGVVGSGEQHAVPSYEVTEVKRKLFRDEPAPEIQLDVGARPNAGDLLRTGSRSSAEIVSHEYGARFLLKARTLARLAGDRPGVLLEVQRGSVRALFDTLDIDDQPDRVVTTPSAVLAVRGTEYGVEVSKSGDTNVTVFSGAVDVIDSDRRGPPVRVPAGQYCTIRRGGRPSSPKPHQMSRKDWDRGERPGSSSRWGGAESMGGQGAGGMGSGGSMSGGGSGGSNGSSRSRGGGGSKGGGGGG